jgi:hypothetical protein
MKNFPLTVPVSIMFTYKFNLGPEDYTVHDYGVSFPMPECTDDNDCAANFSDTVYLSHEDFGSNIVSLGRFTFLPASDALAATAVGPEKAYFVQEPVLTVYGWGFADANPAPASVVLTRGEDKLTVPVTAVSASALTIQAPASCAAVAAPCHDGSYAVAILDANDKPIGVDGSVAVTLVNNPHAAVEVTLRLTREYAPEDQSQVLAQTVAAVKAALDVPEADKHRVEGMQTHDALKKVVSSRRSPPEGLILRASESFAVLKMSRVQLKRAALDATGAHTAVTFMIRPVHDHERPAPADYAAKLKAQLEDTESQLYTLLPELDTTPGVHSQATVHWCEDKGEYRETCEDETSSNDGNMFRAILLVLGVLAVVGGVAYYIVQKKKQKENAMGLLDEHAAFYNELN